MIRCDHCGRPLKGYGTRHPILGTLGPECASKFAGLANYLEALGLADLEFQPAVIDMVQLGEGGFQHAPKVHEFKRRAELAGLRVRLGVIPASGAGHTPKTEITLEAPRSTEGKKKLVAALETYGRAAWEAQIKRNALAQTEAQDWGRR